MEIITIQKHIHTSPRKLKLVADMVRKMKPGAALNVLRFTDKAAAEPLSKAIKTVLANAREQKVKEEELVFKTLEINEGPSGKRYRAGTRGRTKPYKKRTSHIRIVLTDDQVQISTPIKSGSNVSPREAGKDQKMEKEASDGKKD